MACGFGNILERRVWGAQRTRHVRPAPSCKIIGNLHASEWKQHLRWAVGCARHLVSLTTCLPGVRCGLEKDGRHPHQAVEDEARECHQKRSASVLEQGRCEWSAAAVW